MSFIIKQVKTSFPLNINSVDRYIRDLKNLGVKVPHDENGKKLSGSLNCSSENRKKQLNEISGLVNLHDNEKSTQAASHQVLSYPAGIRPSGKKIEQHISIYLKKLGMDDHLVIWDAHQDTKNIHVHILLCRVQPYPDEDGRYPIKNNGIVKKQSKKRGLRTDEAACRQTAIAAICDIEGWQQWKHLRYDAHGNKLQQNIAHDRQSDKTQCGERKTGYKSTERKLAELGKEIFTTSRTWEKCDNAFLKHGIEMIFVTKKVKGKQNICGGKLVDSNGRSCKFSRCGNNCSYYKLREKFGNPPSHNDNIIYSQEKTVYRNEITIEEAKKRLLIIFEQAKDWRTLIGSIEFENMLLLRSGGGLIVTFNGGKDYIKTSSISNKYSKSKLELLFGNCPDYVDYKEYKKNNAISIEPKDMSDIEFSRFTQVICEDNPAWRDAKYKLSEQGITLVEKNNYNDGKKYIYGEISCGSNKVTLGKINISLKQMKQADFNKYNKIDELAENISKSRIDIKNNNSKNITELYITKLLNTDINTNYTPTQKNIMHPARLFKVITNYYVKKKEHLSTWLALHGFTGKIVSTCCLFDDREELAAATDTAAQALTLIDDLPNTRIAYPQWQSLPLIRENNNALDIAQAINKKQQNSNISTIIYSEKLSNQDKQIVNSYDSVNKLTIQQTINMRG